MVCFGNHFTPEKNHQQCIIILSIKIKVTKHEPIIINDGWSKQLEKEIWLSKEWQLTIKETEKQEWS